MSKGSKEARRRQKERRQRRQEKRNELVEAAWEKVRSRPTPETQLLKRFDDLKPILEDDGYEAILLAAQKLARIVFERAPKIVDRAAPLWVLARHAPDWVRPLDNWQPKGKGAEAQFRSLVNHLIVKYPVPAFLYRVFETTVRNVRMSVDRIWPLVTFFVRVAQGTSVYKLTKIPVEDGGLVVPLTKRMCHRFMQSPAKSGFIEAIRRAQVEVLGGDHRLVRAIIDSPLGDRFLPGAEAFWMTVIQWFARHSMLDPNQVGPLFDYISHLRREDNDFSITGRSPLALLRGMERWHNELAHVRKLTGKPFEPSGFEAGVWENKRREKSGNFVVTRWTMTELLGSKALAKEGRAMSHCVYSYGRSIESGSTSIWSLQRNDERMVTVEVRNRHQSVVQVRGKANRRPTASEINYVRRWADENGLVLRAGY
jgi:hypothetical protein